MLGGDLVSPPVNGATGENSSIDVRAVYEVVDELVDERSGGTGLFEVVELRRWDRPAPL